MGSLNTVFKSGKHLIFTRDDLVSRSEIPWLKKTLKNKKSEHFPPLPKAHNRPHVIVHFPSDLSQQIPLCSENDPHAGYAFLLQAKTPSNGYCAALFDCLKGAGDKGQDLYILCDITFDRYLHNRPVKKDITEADINLFFKYFGRTVLSNVSLKRSKTLSNMTFS